LIPLPERIAYLIAEFAMIVLSELLKDVVDDAPAYGITPDVSAYVARLA
jgi:hypothetical protein